MSQINILAQRLVNQHLVGAKLETPAQVVELLGAVQAQDYAGAKWGLALRMKHASDAELDAAFDAGEILRTHVLRPTWHFVTPNDIRWLLELTAPRVNAFNASMYRKYELDDATFKKSNALLEKALRGGKQKTRAELAAVLEQNGIVPQDSVRLSLLMMRAELDALICSGARRGKQFTYALLEERAPNAKSLHRDEALYELTRRYFSTRGPATAQDFAWWSGLTVADAKKGLELCQAFFVSEKVDNQVFWFAASAPPKKSSAPRAQLLPNFDEYFIGFKDRSAFSNRITTASLQRIEQALLMHIVFIRGEIVGGWRRTLKKISVVVALDFLTTLTETEQRAVRDAAEAYAKFLGLKLELTEAKFTLNGRGVNLFS